jgi:hypothetical protein
MPRLYQQVPLILVGDSSVVLIAAGLVGRTGDQRGVEVTLTLLRVRILLIGKQRDVEAAMEQDALVGPRFEQAVVTVRGVEVRIGMHTNLRPVWR